MVGATSPGQEGDPAPVRRSILPSCSQVSGGWSGKLDGQMGAGSAKMQTPSTVAHQGGGTSLVPIERSKRKWLGNLVPLKKKNMQC